MTGIYFIINNENGKRYIGQAVSIKMRIQGHFKRLRSGKHHCAHLQLAFNKYGQDAFTHSILEKCQKENLVKREQFWMDYFRSDGLYNTAPAAGSNLGMKFSAETRAKMSAKLTGRPVSDETKAQMSASRMGWKPSGETRAKMSKAKEKMSAETKEKMSKAQLGKKRSESTKAKMRKAKEGKPHAGHVLTYVDFSNRAGCKLSEEHKAKVSASLMGNKRRLGSIVSRETRAKLSEKTRQYWESRKTL